MLPPLTVKWPGDAAAISSWTGGVPVETLAPGAAPKGTLVSNAIFPHIRGDNDGSGFSAGPTGEPWIDANGWKIRAARVREPQSPLWLGYEFPKGAVVTPERYALCVAEAGVYGAGWLIAPDEELRRATEAKTGAAPAIWKKIAAAHEAVTAARAGREAWRELARIVVASDFMPPERILAMETVNMAARKQLTTRLLRPADANPANLQEAAAILWMDRKPVAAPVADFVRNGGMLFVNAMVPPLEGTALADDSHPRFQIRSLGQGRVAASRKPWTDPFLIAGDVQLLASKRSEVLKLWNAGSMIGSALEAPGGESAVVHLLNYTCRAAGHPVSLRLERKYARARLRTLEAPGPADLTIERAPTGVEVGLPPFGVYATVEFTS